MHNYPLWWELKLKIQNIPVIVAWVLSERAGGYGDPRLTGWCGRVVQIVVCITTSRGLGRGDTRRGWVGVIMFIGWFLGWACPQRFYFWRRTSRWRGISLLFTIYSRSSRSYSTRKVKICNIKHYYRKSSLASDIDYDMAITKLHRELTVTISISLQLLIVSLHWFLNWWLKRSAKGCMQVHDS